MPRPPSQEIQEEELTPRQQAARRFSTMIDDCGSEVIRMPASCEMYLTRYLMPFPDEAKLLTLVLRADIPRELLSFESKRGYDELLNAKIQEFNQAHKLPKGDAKWAIETWAAGLGRPRGFVFVKPDFDPTEYYPNPEQDKRTDGFVKAAMMFIVGAGAFFGTFCGVMLVPIFAWSLITTMVLTFDPELLGGGNQALTNFLLVFIAATACGLFASAAAIMGWMFGGGDTRPWATASTASGAGFMSVFTCIFLALFCCMPIIFAPFVHFGLVFYPTYKSAARGGHY